LVIELLRDADKDIRALALEQVRTDAKGEAATLKFAELLPTLPPETQVGLLKALAGRGDMAGAPAVRKLLVESQESEVKLAALAALGALGNETDVATLAEQLDGGSEDAQEAARTALVRLSGPPASQAIIERMESATGEHKVALIEILTERRAGEKELLVAAVADDAQVRSAAMSALGQIASPEHIAAMVQGILKAAPGNERVAAERAVAQVCQRIPQSDQQVAPLLAALDDLQSQQRIDLIPALGRVGGSGALAAAEAAYRDANPELSAAGLAALCNWPDGSLAPRLLELARTEPSDQRRTQVRRALIRIAPLDDARSDARRLDLLKTLYVMAADDAERKLVLDRAKAVRTVETLRFVAPLMDDPKLGQQACLTVVELAHHSGLREAHRDEFHAALDRVIATSQDATVVDRAQRYKKGQTWVRPKAAS
jgi:HEAT repeat protein